MKYVRAEHLQRRENMNVAKAQADDDEELALLLKPDDILANEARQKVLFLGQ